ncbi:MAG: hypothetical protein IKB77_03670 [Lentisphaeria bacterium]|nr:hypothetical protein [Lentisphaeria bacterium]
MKYIRSILIFAVCVFLFSCTHQTQKLTDAEIFVCELNSIYEQQSSMRKELLLQSLQQEYRKATTLSSISSFELMLENSELSEAEKKQTLLKNLEQGLLYMQISLFPPERDKILSRHIRNTLLYETASVFLRLTLAENFLAKSLQLPENDANRQLQSRIINSMDEPKIEYAALRINDLNAIEKMPRITYPLNDIPPFANLEDFRNLKGGKPISETAKSIYDELNSRHGSSLALVLIKLLYKSPAALAALYYNDNVLKKEFCILLTELVRLYQSEELFNAMQNTFTLRSDMQQSTAGNQNISPQMLEANLKSELAYQQACLHMLSFSGLSPFAPLPENKIQTPPPQKNTATLRLMFEDIQRNIL